METTNLHDKLNRQDRLNDDWIHLFPLKSMVNELRAEEEYATNGHTGLTLLKTPTLRVVLGVAKAGSKIGEHTIHGPTVIHVMEGSLRLKSEDETRNAHSGEMIVVPNDRPRSLEAEEPSSFLWILAVSDEP